MKKIRPLEADFFLYILKKAIFQNIYTALRAVANALIVPICIENLTKIPKFALSVLFKPPKKWFWKKMVVFRAAVCYFRVER